MRPARIGQARCTLAMSAAHALPRRKPSPSVFELPGFFTASTPQLSSVVKMPCQRKALLATTSPRWTRKARRPSWGGAGGTVPPPLQDGCCRRQGPGSTTFHSLRSTCSTRVAALLPIGLGAGTCCANAAPAGGPAPGGQATGDSGWGDSGWERAGELCWLPRRLLHWLPCALRSTACSRGGGVRGPRGVSSLEKVRCCTSRATHRHTRAGSCRVFAQPGHPAHEPAALSGLPPYPHLLEKGGRRRWRADLCLPAICWHQWQAAFAVLDAAPLRRPLPLLLMPIQLVEHVDQQVEQDEVAHRRERDVVQRRRARGGLHRIEQRGVERAWPASRRVGAGAGEVCH